MIRHELMLPANSFYRIWISVVQTCRIGLVRHTGVSESKASSYTTLMNATCIWTVVVHKLRNNVHRVKSAEEQLPNPDVLLNFDM